MTEQFEGFEGWQTAVLDAGKKNSKKPSPLWRGVFRVLRAGKRQFAAECCPARGSFGPSRAQQLPQMRPWQKLTFHTSGVPRRRLCLGIGRGRRINDDNEGEVADEDDEGEAEDDVDDDGDDDGDDGDYDDDDDDDRKLTKWMWRRRRGKMTRWRGRMLRREADPKTGKHTLCEPARPKRTWTLEKCRTPIPDTAFCASLRGRNAHGQFEKNNFV